jgi:hypothetical protein
VGHH